LEFSDDDLFEDSAFEDALAQAESQGKTAVAQHNAPLQEMDDSLLDDESFSQALARAEKESITPKPHSRSKAVEVDDFEDADLSDGQLLAALEAVTPAKKHAITPDENQRTERTGLEAAQPVNFAQVNRERPFTVKFKPWTKIPHVGEDEFGDPDFEDPEVLAALEDAERHGMRSIVAPVQELVTDAIQITRAELEAIKRNAFVAGQANHHKMWKRRYVFELLKLPAGRTDSFILLGCSLTSLDVELRLVIYEYAARDTNLGTAGKYIQALPTRSQILDYLGIVIVESSHWQVPEKKPWINTALLRTCKQIYREVRDDVLYKDRQFEARATLNSQFKHIMKEAPKLAFWQHMQHLHLILRPTDHRQQWRRHVQHGIEGLSALMRGGKKLKSFHLSWEFTQFSDRIELFRDLRISGSIVVTQHFDDGTVKAGKDEEAEREIRIRQLMLSMQGLRREYLLTL
jgi:hypothetical protein